MKEDFDKISVSFKGYNNRTNEALYGLRHNGGNGNLWYKVDDENYASVSVERKETNPVYEDYSGQTNSTYNDNQIIFTYSLMISIKRLMYLGK